jgi:hypothetical protein
VSTLSWDFTSVSTRRFSANAALKFPRDKAVNNIRQHSKDADAGQHDGPHARKCRRLGPRIRSAPHERHDPTHTCADSSANPAKPQRESPTRVITAVRTVRAGGKRQAATESHQRTQ